MEKIITSIKEHAEDLIKQLPKMEGVTYEATASLTSIGGGGMHGNGAPYIELVSIQVGNTQKIKVVTDLVHYRINNKIIDSIGELSNHLEVAIRGVRRRSEASRELLDINTWLREKESFEELNLASLGEKIHYNRVFTWSFGTYKISNPQFVKITESKLVIIWEKPDWTKLYELIGKPRIDVLNKFRFITFGLIDTHCPIVSPVFSAGSDPTTLIKPFRFFVGPYLSSSFEHIFRKALLFIV